MNINSINNSPDMLSQLVSTKLLKKTLDTQTEAMQQILASLPDIGQNIDVKA